MFLLICLQIQGQNNVINKQHIEEDFNQLLNNLSKYYVYGKEKKVDFMCLKTYYKNQIQNIKTEEETVLFFEYILDEFYDSHLTLNTNRAPSFRLHSPIYVTLKEDKTFITNVWQTQIKTLNTNILGAEILKFNNIPFQELIKNFPTQCNDKNNLEVREWIANKVLAGRYNEPRKLIIKLKNGAYHLLDLDKIEIKKEKELLSFSKNKNDIGIIRINNSLGQDKLVNVFDKAIDTLFNTKGLILDLRNTVDGGDSYEARGIMSRFIDKPKPYQKHTLIEYSNNNPDIERSWVEYVTPRLKAYNKPVVILVGRWTGSMGEGLAIGFEGIERGHVVGSEMERLAGEIFFFQLINQNYGYRIPAAKLSHVNGTPREKYVPTQYVKQTTLQKDETLVKAINLLVEKINKN